MISIAWEGLHADIVDAQTVVLVTSGYAQVAGIAIVTTEIDEPTCNTVVELGGFVILQVI